MQGVRLQNLINNAMQILYDSEKRAHFDPVFHPKSLCKKFCTGFKIVYACIPHDRK